MSRFFLLCALGVVSLSTSCKRESALDAGGVARVWVLEEDFRLGTLEGSSPETFGNSIVLEATTRGILVVGDPQSAEVRYFDTEGRHVRTVGGRGMGPGEYQDIIGFSLDADERLWVADRVAGRISVLDREGSLLETHPYSGFGNLGWGGRVDLLGRLHNPILLVAETGLQPGFERWTNMERDTLVIPPYEVVEREVVSPGSQTRRVRVPFTPRPHWTIDSEGFLWYGSSEAYILYRMGYGGDTIQTISRTATQRVPLSPEERQEALETLQGPFGSAAFVDPSWIPASRPVFEGLFADDQRRLWVTVPRGGGSWGFEVLDLEGNLIAEVEIPPHLTDARQPLVRGGFMYVVVRDELDVPYIVRLRIVP